MWIYRSTCFRKRPTFKPEPEWDGFNLRRSGASPEDIQKTLDLVLQAKRPVIFIGHGVTLSEASKELTEFAHALQIPVISSPNGMGCLDMTDPLSLGFIGRNGAYPANQAGRHTDLVLAIGARFDDRSSSSWMPGYSWNFPQSKLIHVDVDHSEIGRNYTPDLGVLADARTFLVQLLADLSRRKVDKAGRLREWHADIAKWRAEWEAYIRPNFEIHASPLRPERIVADCRAVLPDDAIISLDSGIHHNWFMQFWSARRPQTMLNTWGYSGMGFGPSSILGAKLAAPDRPCVSICGDGGFTMVPHVLCTAVEYDIPAVWVVWNNFSWAAIRDLQYAYFDGREIGTGFYQGPERKPYNPDFAAWARAAGVEGLRSRNPRISKARWPTPSRSTSLASSTCMSTPTSGRPGPVPGRCRRYRTRSRYSARSTSPGNSRLPAMPVERRERRKAERCARVGGAAITSVPPDAAMPKLKSRKP